MKYGSAAYLNFRSSRSQNVDRFSFDEILSMWSSGLLHYAAWQIMYSIDFLFLCAAKLIVLDRMRGFSVPQQNKIATVARWAVPTIFILGCVAGVCGSIASAVTRRRAVSVLAEAISAAILFKVASSSQSKSLRNQVDASYERLLEVLKAAELTDSVSQFSEMVMLVLLVACFLVAGILCAHRVRSVMRSSTSGGGVSASAKRLHRQIVLTAAVVFVTFLPRAVFISLKAVSGGLQDLDTGECLVPCSDVAIRPTRADFSTPTSCKTPFNQYVHMSLFLFYTPEFLLLVVLISSLSQVVALWAMTSDRMLQAFGFLSNSANPQLLAR
jgi:hypothetical protein